MSELDPRAVERVSGPSWQALKPAVLAIGEAILSADAKAKNELTTIYVKFERPGGAVYAVMWIKKSTEVVVGLALPTRVVHERLHDAPKGMSYPGLTRYFTVKGVDDIPADLPAWATAAVSIS